MNKVLDYWRRLQEYKPPVFLNVVSSGLSPNSAVFAIVVTTPNTGPDVYCIRDDAYTEMPGENIKYHGLSTNQWITLAMPKKMATGQVHAAIEHSQVFGTGVCPFLRPLLAKFDPLLLTDASFMPMPIVDLVLAYGANKHLEAAPEDTPRLLDPSLASIPGLISQQEHWDDYLHRLYTGCSLRDVVESAALQLELPVGCPEFLAQAFRMRALFMSML